MNDDAGIGLIIKIMFNIFKVVFICALITGTLAAMTNKNLRRINKK